MAGAGGARVTFVIFVPLRYSIFSVCDMLPLLLALPPKMGFVLAFEGSIVAGDA